MKRLLLLILFVCATITSVSSKSIGKIYVVSVGISDYKNIQDLNLPEQDAKDIANLYKTKTKHVILITGRYATKSRILQSLRNQFARANENDMVVFSFSGHGFQGGICPYDMSEQFSSGITFQEIRSILKQSRAKCKVIFADACFSGGMRENSNHNISHLNNDNSNILLFLSSRGGESSIESPFMANGLFTTYLIRGFRGGADYNFDKKITAKELFNFVHNGVVGKSNSNQHPVMWGQFDDNWILMDWR